MPPARARSRQRQAEPEPEESTASMNGDKDFTVYADKDITPTMEAFADFLIDEVFEGDISDYDEESFRKGVALGGSVRMDFQRSQFWADDPRNRKNKQVEEDEEEEAPTPRRSGRAKARQQASEEEQPKARSTRRGRKATPEPEPEPDDEDEDEQDIEDEAEDIEEDEVESEPEPEPAKPARRSRRGTAAAKKNAETDAAPKTSGRRTSRRGGKQAESSGAAPY